MKKLNLANTPTRIESIQLVDADLPMNLYMKRDDLTGLALSGNKVRKLEYILQDAINSGVTDIITCGAIQSNHARATAMAGAKLGLNTHLLLAGDASVAKEGNNFLDILAGASQRFISGEDYDHKRNELMEDWAKEIETEASRKALVIPEGGSTGLGSFGYVDCFNEILEQERELEVTFDLICVTVGSAGTYTGLVYGNKAKGLDRKIMGITISNPAGVIRGKLVPPIVEEMNQLNNVSVEIGEDDLTILDGYQGRGYAKSRVEELEFIHDFTSQTGIILDPVYTGKAMYGLFNEILKGNLDNYKNILFIHTGGAFGWTKEQIKLLLEK